MSKIAIVYASITGNTKEVAEKIWTNYKLIKDEVHIRPIEFFPLYELEQYDGLIIGTYTWGNGEIPQELIPLYKEIENGNYKKLVTAVFGTGDSFYPYFCGAVNEWRDMLFIKTSLAATLKIELSPQKSDEQRIKQFITSFNKKINNNLANV